jgi:hypothetical protein
MASFLESVDETRNAIKHVNFAVPELTRVSDSAASFKHEIAQTRAKIDPAGEVVDDASPELRTIRDRLRKQRGRLKGTLESYLRGRETAKYLQDQVVTERNGRYVLVVQRSDRPFTADLLAGMSNQVRRIFARNCYASHPRVEAIPIGLAEHDLPHGCWENIEAALREPRGDGLLYAGFALDTNPRRIEAVNAVGGLATLDIYPHWQTRPQNHLEFLRRMRRHRFVLSPPGNGADCHRTWEALYLGCTPVCLDEPPIRPLAALFPILLVSRWQDVTRERLEAWREPQWDRRALEIGFWGERFVGALAA